MPGPARTDLVANPPFQPLADSGEDADVLRNAFGCIPTGVVAVGALVDGEPTCLVASSFVGVSMSPPLVAFCVQWTSQTWPRLKDLPRLGISVLGEEHNETVRRLASKAANKFDQLGLCIRPQGAIFIGGATAWIECSVEDMMPAGDHGIVLLRIHELALRPYEEPLVFHRSSFRHLTRDDAADQGEQPPSGAGSTSPVRDD